MGLRDGMTSSNLLSKIAFFYLVGIGIQFRILCIRLLPKENLLLVSWYACRGRATVTGGTSNYSTNCTNYQRTPSTHLF